MDNNNKYVIGIPLVFDLIIVLGAIFYFGQLDTMVATHEREIREIRTQTITRAEFALLDKRLDRIENKLDQAIQADNK